MSTQGHESEAINVSGLKASLKKGGNIGIYNEAICSTAGGTAAKVTNTTPPSFTLTAGAKILVKFTYAISAENATLQVGSNSAKPIYYKGSALPADLVKAGTSLLLSYDGTSFNIVGDINTDTTYSTMGASGSTHSGGLVPDTPSTAGTTKFLREDGTWQEPAGSDFTNVAFLEDASQEATVADFDLQSDTVWKKAQTLSAAEKAQVKANIGVDKDIENLQELYEALTQSDIEIVNSVPASGVANKIYRVVGESSYADYMFNANALTTPIKMAEYDNAIDDKPTAGSDNLVKSGGVEGFFETGKNLFFDNYIKTGSYNTSTGIFDPSQISTRASIKIPVYPSAKYAMSGVDGTIRYFLWDSNKQLLSTTTLGLPAYVSIPNNCHYLSIQMPQALYNPNSIQIELGIQNTTYEKAYHTLLNSATPEMFGAKGDGITDDSSAINKAVASSKYVVFGNGKTYKVEESIVVPSNKIIEGNNCVILSTIVNTGQNIGSLSINLSGSNIRIKNFIIKSKATFIGSSLGHDLTIENLKLETSETHESSGAESMIWLNGCYNVAINNISFNGYDGVNYYCDGVHINGGCHDIYIDGVTGVCLDDFIALNAVEGSGVISKDIQNIHVRNVYSNRSYGIRLYGFGDTPNSGGQTITNCSFSNCFFNLNTNVPAFRAINSIGLGGQSLQGITLNNVVVENSIFISNSYALYFTRELGNITFKNCIFESTELQTVYSENASRGSYTFENCKFFSNGKNVIDLRGEVTQYDSDELSFFLKLYNCEVNDRNNAGVGIVLGAFNDIYIENCDIKTPNFFSVLNEIGYIKISNCKLSDITTVNLTNKIREFYTEGTEYVPYNVGEDYAIYTNYLTSTTLFTGNFLGKNGARSSLYSGNKNVMLRGLYPLRFQPEIAYLGDYYIDIVNGKFSVYTDGWN